MVGRISRREAVAKLPSDLEVGGYRDTHRVGG